MLDWDHNVLWIWQSMHVLDQAPYFKREYACAVEPFTSLPHQLYGDKDPLPVLKGGQRLETALKAFIYRQAIPRWCWIAAAA